MRDRPSLCGAARESPKHSSHFGQKHIFQNLLQASQSTSYKSPIAAQENGLEPAASGCPLRRQCKKGLCATGAAEWRQVQGWVEPHPQSALASATTCSAVAGVAAVYTTSATVSQCGWRVGSDLAPSCLTTCNGLARTAA